MLQQLIHTKYVLNKKTYYNLYKTKAVDTDSIKSFLNNIPILPVYTYITCIPQLSEEQKLSCEGQITIEECKGILETFENNKSPGNDGIPSEFYKNC